MCRLIQISLSLFRPEMINSEAEIQLVQMCRPILINKSQLGHRLTDPLLHTSCADSTQFEILDHQT